MKKKSKFVGKEFEAIGERVTVAFPKEKGGADTVLYYYRPDSMNRDNCPVLNKTGDGIDVRVHHRLFEYTDKKGETTCTVNGERIGSGYGRSVGEWGCGHVGSGVFPMSDLSEKFHKELLERALSNSNSTIATNIIRIGECVGFLKMWENKPKNTSGLPNRESLEETLKERRQQNAESIKLRNLAQKLLADMEKQTGVQGKEQ